MKRIVSIVSLLLFSIVAWGQGVIMGYVYEQDYQTPIEGATVVLSGYGIDGDTLVSAFITDSLGYYEAQVEEGTYQVSAWKEGYEPDYILDSLVVEGSQYFAMISFVLHELYTPVSYVFARQFSNDLVRLSWSMYAPPLFEDFETGDFSSFNWNNSLSDHPWAVDTTDAYEGQYCMRSTVEDRQEGCSEIEVPVYVPWSGEMCFHSRISSEPNCDKGYFYIDGVQLLECSGESGWEEHRFAITEGEHVFRWAYVKDANINEGDDCFYVDDISFFVEEGMKGQLSFQYYDLYRRRFDEEAVLLASHLSDTVYMEMNWNSLSWGKYQWGVSCVYEGNRGTSDTIWSALLDRDMTTTLQIDVTTNVGLSAQGAEVTVSSESHEYHGTVNSDGFLTLPEVYRDNYLVTVILEGFVDYVSDTQVTVMEPTQIEVELFEAVKGVDSLYVSSTGWAMWELSDTLYRNLQYFEIQVDGTPAGTTVHPFCQIDVDHLNPGDSCCVAVRPVYLSDTCGWCSCFWVYRSCTDFEPAAEPTAALRENGVLISWSYPENDSVVGTVIYRDGIFLGFTEADSYLDETVVMQGTVEYGLQVVYDGESPGSYYSMACATTLGFTFPAFCDPPTKLYAENYMDNGEYGALVTWGERPEPNEAWLHYDNGQYKNALGGSDEPVIYWSVRFDAEQLSEYQGTTLRKVALFDIDAGNYQLWIYKGGNTAPHTLLHMQNMNLTGSNAWHEEPLVPQIEVPDGEPLWVVVGQQGLSRPAAVCEDMGNPDGRWVSLNGVDWTDLYTYNMPYTWMLRAFVSDRYGRLASLGGDNYSLQSYNLYRSYDNIEYQQLVSVSSVEGQQYYQYRDVLVGETHHEFYYKLTAVYLSDENEECESDFATSLSDPERDYVMVDDAWGATEGQVTEVELYPNPNDGCFVVRASGMRQVNVLNAFGQCVEAKSVDGDAVRLELTDCPSGVYLLRVVTQNGLLCRRFVVSR